MGKLVWKTHVLQPTALTSLVDGLRLFCLNPYLQGLLLCERPAWRPGEAEDERGDDDDDGGGGGVGLLGLLLAELLF